MFPLLLIFSPIILVFVVLPLLAVMAVQKRLCRRKPGWLGLILPGIALLYGLFLTVTMSVVMLHYEGPPLITHTSYTTPAGAPSSYEPPPEEVTVEYFPDPNHPLTVSTVGGFLFVFNIPALSLGWIWLKNWREEKAREELGRMKRQELE